MDHARIFIGGTKTPDALPISTTRKKTARGRQVVEYAALTKTPGMELRIGDLIQCRDNHYNQGLGIVHKIGMIAELRRNDARVLFDVDNQSIWISKTGVNRITLPPAESPGLLDRLSWLIRFVDAEECELELDVAGNYRYTVVCAALSLERLHSIREYMNYLFVELNVLPRGMSRLGLEVVFRRETTPS